MFYLPANIEANIAKGDFDRVSVISLFAYVIVKTKTTVNTLAIENGLKVALAKKWTVLITKINCLLMLTGWLIVTLQRFFHVLACHLPVLDGLN